MKAETLEMLKRLISDEKCLSNYPTDEIVECVQVYMNNCAFLYRLYTHTFKNSKDVISDDWKDVEVSSVDSGYRLSYGIEGKTLLLDRNQMLRLLIIAIDALDEILPLGTVVDLKKEYLRKNLPVDEVDKVRVVITHRFLSGGNNKYYFPYAGVIYPFGAPNESKYINFTSHLIEDVVHRGFSDEQDEAYILLMKHELLEEKRIHSFGFASRDDLESFQKQITSEVG